MLVGRGLGRHDFVVLKQLQIARVRFLHVVRRLVEDDQTKRLIGFARADELDRTSRQVLRIVHALAVVIEKILPLAAPGVPHVEKLFGRRSADAPFAEASCPIAGLLEQRRKARGEHVGGQRRVEVADPVVSAQPAGEVAGPRHATDRCGDKGVREIRAVRGQAIDVRRLEQRMAGDGQAIPALIVGQKEHDVRPPIGSGGGKGVEYQQRE